VKVNGIEKAQICVRLIRCGSYQNRYHYWRHVEGCDVISAAFMAFVTRIIHGV
jgi:hypothetical protein